MRLIDIFRSKWVLVQLLAKERASRKQYKHWWDEEYDVITFLMGMILSVIGYFIYAHAASCGWHWFITSEFGIAAPAPIVCLGFVLLVKLCTSCATLADIKTVLEADERESFSLTFLNYVFNHIFTPLLLWLTMYVVYCLAY